MLVCENHRDKAWPEECDCGPGMRPEPSMYDRAQWLYEEALMGDTYSRHSSFGQVMLAFLRDYVAYAEGRDPEAIQNEYEARAAKNLSDDLPELKTYGEWKAG